MLHQQSQKIYENHQLILDHFDNEDNFYKSTFTQPTSTSSPESQYVIQPIQQFRVIKDARNYEDGRQISNFYVSSTETEMDRDEQMAPPIQSPQKPMKVIEEPTSSMPDDLGKFKTVVITHILTFDYEPGTHDKSRNFRLQNRKENPDKIDKIPFALPFHFKTLPQFFTAGDGRMGGREKCEL